MLNKRVKWNERYTGYKYNTTKNSFSQMQWQSILTSMSRVTCTNSIDSKSHSMSHHVHTYLSIWWNWHWTFHSVCIVLPFIHFMDKIHIYIEYVCSKRHFQQISYTRIVSYSFRKIKVIKKNVYTILGLFISG